MYPRTEPCKRDSTYRYVDGIRFFNEPISEWNEYRGLNFIQLKKLMKDSVFIDLRNVYESADMKELGFEYFCIGRPG